MVAAGTGVVEGVVVWSGAGDSVEEGVAPGVDDGTGDNAGEGVEVAE